MTLSAFVKPFDTWSDMGQVVPAEGWRRPPRTIAYFCGALHEPDDGETIRGRRLLCCEPGESSQTTRSRFSTMRCAICGRRRRTPSAAFAGSCWSTWVNSNPAKRSCARRRRGRTRAPDRSRFNSQFWVANVNPTDRYTQSIPGSAEHRISPLDNTYDNLTVAGDWTELRAQSRLRRGGGDVGAAGGACPVRFAGAGRNRRVRSSLSGGGPLTIERLKWLTIVRNATTRREPGPIGQAADCGGRRWAEPGALHRPRVIDEPSSSPTASSTTISSRAGEPPSASAQGTYSSADFDSDLKHCLQRALRAFEGVGRRGDGFF